VWKTNADGSQLIYNLGDVSWVLTSVGNVFILAAGVGFFYSGLLRRKNSLSALYVSMAAIAVVSIEVCKDLFNKNTQQAKIIFLSFQWFLWGFTLAFSDRGNVFIGNLSVLLCITLQALPDA
jgi:Amt family ammonium transporter